MGDIYHRKNLQFVNWTRDSARHNIYAAQGSFGTLYGNRSQPNSRRALRPPGYEEEAYNPWSDQVI